MLDNEPDISKKQAATRISESDDFSLPIAPPPSPQKTGPNTIGPTKRLPKASHSVTAAPPAATQPLPVQGVSIQEPSAEPNDPSAEQLPSGTDQAQSSSLVAWLICTVVVLLIVIIIQFNQAADSDSPPLLSSSGNDSDLAAARNETKAARNEVTQGERKIRDLEKQLEASQNTAEGKVASLLEENKRLKMLSSELDSETARLKGQLQTATRPTTVSESPPPVQKTPVAQQDGQIYRVAGLRPGDTLNIRSGPGTNYPTITALQNGVRVTVTGAAVMNGPDSWLPCIIALSGVDPTTGSNRSWNQDCWINSFFLEQIEHQ